MSRALTAPRIASRIPPPPRAGKCRAESDALLTGDVLDGRYQIETPLGEGGIGIVYRALQLKLNRRVAVKLLLRERVGDQLLRPRFEREAVTLAALSHPNIVSLNDYGVVRGRPFLVMEMLTGRMLRDVIEQEGCLPLGRALALTRQVLFALSYAHNRGVVHRDLKPANISVETLPDQPEHLKLLDFGLAKLLPGSGLDSGQKLSRVGFAYGTPDYMSPEQATGAELDGRSDLYSLGIVLFEMLTGEKPFRGPNEDVLRAHVVAPPPRLAELNPELTARADVQAFLDRALSKAPEDRFASAHDMRVALELLMPREDVRVHTLADHSLEHGWSRLRSAVEPATRRMRVIASRHVAPRLRGFVPTARLRLGVARGFCASAYAKALAFALPATSDLGAVRLRPLVTLGLQRGLTAGRRVLAHVRDAVRGLTRRPSRRVLLLPAPRPVLTTAEGGQADTESESR